MNKQSNLYTVIYIVAMVVVVGAALAFTSMSLKDRQQANIDADKMRQILASIHKTADPGQDISDTYARYITRSFMVNAAGDRVSGDAFTADVAAQSKLPDAERTLPVFVATLPDGATKYILPVYGAGLWGPIWGYVALDANGSTVYGAYFAHQGETPGLGAEIAKADFSGSFTGKNLFTRGTFQPIAVIKKGSKAPEGRDWVDGVSGGTITSKGVEAMLDNCLRPYANFLQHLND